MSIPDDNSYWPQEMSEENNKQARIRKTGYLTFVAII